MCYYALLWWCVDICDYVLLCVAIDVFLCAAMWQSVAICDYVLLCVAMWQSVAIRDNVLLCVAICFYVREFVACDCVSMCDNVLWFSAMCDDVLLLWLRVTMCCYVTICCYLWRCVIVCCCWLCVTMRCYVTMCCYCDYVLLCVAICFYVRECVACDGVSMYDNVLWFSAICDDLFLLWLCVTMRCYVTICCYL
jgi:hypothetical protein